MSDDFTRDFLNTDIGVGELRPGTTKRRWEPEVGMKKHRERIHRESKFADDHKNLPFTFSKPKKPSRNAVVRCSNCGALFSANVNTVGIICSSCKQFSVVEVVD